MAGLAGSAFCKKQCLPAHELFHCCRFKQKSCKNCNCVTWLGDLKARWISIFVNSNIYFIFFIFFIFFYLCLKLTGTNILGKIWYLVSSPFYRKRFHFKSLGLELQAASSSELMTCIIIRFLLLLVAGVLSSGWNSRFCQLEKPVYCHRLLVLSQFHLGTSRRWWVFHMYPHLW